MAGTVTQAVRWWARETPDATALAFEDDTVSYRDLDQWTDQVAILLTGKGVRPGDRVGVVGPNGLEYVAAALGASKAGAIWFPINTRFVAAEVAHLLGDTGTSIVIAGPEHELVVAAAASDQPVEVLPFAAVTEARSGAGERFETPDVPLDQPYMLVYTSGSTGRPKGVIVTYRTQAAMMFEQGLTEPGWRTGMRALCALPLGGMPSFLWGVTPSLFNGGIAVILATFEPGPVIEAIEKYRVTSFMSVPTILERAVTEPRFAGADLSSLESVHVGGARVSPKILAAWRDKGVHARQIYGLTEVGGSMTAVPISQAATRATTCGHGGMFSRFKVVQPDGKECPPGEPGEILVTSPAQTVGYWNNPEQTAKLLENGWIRTGDLGVIDEDGYLTFLDRLKDLIISGGINVAPLEIENTIAAIDGVDEVAVVAVPDQKFGETPGAIVVARPEVTAANIIEHCRQQLANYKVPRYLLMLEKPLPRLAGGKLDKSTIRSEFMDTLTDSPVNA